MNAADPIVILSYARTPMGGFQGALSGASATQLGATAVKAAVERAGVSGDDVEKIYFGCVLPAASVSAAMIAACMPDPHILLTVVASTERGRPAPSAACRAGAWPSPAGSTQPK